MADASEQVDMVERLIARIDAGEFDKDTRTGDRNINWERVGFNDGLEYAATLFSRALQ